MGEKRIQIIGSLVDLFYAPLITCIVLIVSSVFVSFKKHKFLSWLSLIVRETKVLKVVYIALHCRAS